MVEPEAVRKMTPDEVLCALRHFAQLEISYGIVWPGAERISMETTLEEFDDIRGTDGDLEWYLHKYFFAHPISCDPRQPDPELVAFITSGECKSILELCRFLSERVSITRIEPFKILDRPCQPAAIFLTLKARLAANGTNVRHLKPSTPLAKFGLWDLGREAALIAPDKFPLAKPSRRAISWYGCGQNIWIAGFALLLVAVFLNIQLAMIPAGGPALLGLFCLLVIWFTAAMVFPGGDSFPGLRTFRDLCKALAGEPIARHRPPGNLGARVLACSVMCFGEREA